MIKYLFKGVCAFMTIMTGATTLMPATDVETAALGPSLRSRVIQKQPGCRPP